VQPATNTVAADNAIAAPDKRRAIFTSCPKIMTQVVPPFAGV
jgi:hypothetical protein